MPKSDLSADITIRANLDQVTLEFQRAMEKVRQMTGATDIHLFEGFRKDIEATLAKLGEFERYSAQAARHAEARAKSLDAEIARVRNAGQNAVTRALGRRAQGTLEHYQPLVQQAFERPYGSAGVRAQQEALRQLVGVLGNNKQAMDALGRSMQALNGYTIDFDGNVVKGGQNLRKSMNAATKELREFTSAEKSAVQLGTQGWQRLNSAIQQVRGSYDMLDRDMSSPKMLRSTKALETHVEKLRILMEGFGQDAAAGSHAAVLAMEQQLRVVRQLINEHKQLATSAALTPAQRANASRVVAALESEFGAKQGGRMLRRAGAAYQRHESQAWRSERQFTVWEHMDSLDAATAQARHLGQNRQWGDVNFADMERQRAELESLHAQALADVAAYGKKPRGKETAEQIADRQSRLRLAQTLATGMQSRLQSQADAMSHMRREYTTYMTGEKIQQLRDPYQQAHMTAKGLLLQGRHEEVEPHLQAMRQGAADLHGRIGGLGVMAQTANTAEERNVYAQRLQELIELRRRYELEIIQLETARERKIEEVNARELANTRKTEKERRDARKASYREDALARVAGYAAAPGTLHTLDAQGIAQAKLDLAEAMRAHGYDPAMLSSRNMTPVQIKMLQEQLRMSERVRGLAAPSLPAQALNRLLGIRVGGGNWAAFGRRDSSLFHVASHRITNIAQMMGVSLYGMGIFGATNALVKGPIQLAAQIQAQEMAIQGMLQSYGKFVDLQGKALKPAQQLNMALMRSKDIYEEIRETAAKSLISTQELTEGFLTGGPQLMSRGFSTKQVLTLTNQIMMLGRMQGLSSTAIMSDLRDLATGNVNVRSQVLRAAGIDKPGLKAAYAKGGSEEVFAYVQKQMRGFAAAFKTIEHSPMGMLNKFTVTLQRLGQTFGETLVPIILPQLERLRVFMENFARSGEASKFADSLGNIVGGLMGFFVTFIEKLEPYVNTIGKLLTVTLLGYLTTLAAGSLLQSSRMASGVTGIIAAIGLLVNYIIQKRYEVDLAAKNAMEAGTRPISQEEADQVSTTLRRDMGARARTGDFAVPGYVQRHREALRVVRSAGYDTSSIPELEQAAIAAGYAHGPQDTEILQAYNEAATAMGMDAPGFSMSHPETLYKLLAAGAAGPQGVMLGKWALEEHAKPSHVMRGYVDRTQMILSRLKPVLGDFRKRMGAYLSYRQATQGMLPQEITNARVYDMQHLDQLSGKGRAKQVEFMRAWYRKQKMTRVANSLNPPSWEYFASKYPEGASWVGQQLENFFNGSRYMQFSKPPTAEGGPKPYTGGTGMGPQPMTYEEAARAYADMVGSRAERRYQRVGELTMAGGALMKPGLAVAQYGAGVSEALAVWHAAVVEAAGTLKGPMAVQKATIEFQKTLDQLSDAFASEIREIEKAVEVRRQEVALAEEQNRLTQMDIDMRRKEFEVSRINPYAPGATGRIVGAYQQMAGMQISMAGVSMESTIRQQVTNPRAVKAIEDADWASLVAMMPPSVAQTATKLASGTPVSTLDMAEFNSFLATSGAQYEKLGTAAVASKAATMLKNQRARAADAGRPVSPPKSLVGLAAKAYLVSAQARQDYDRGIINPELMRVLGAFDQAGYHLEVGTAKTGHSYRTTTGSVSPHMSGRALDAFRINGKVKGDPGFNAEMAAAQRWGLANLGDGLQLLFGFNDPRRGGDHTNHMHIGISAERAARALAGQSGVHMPGKIGFEGGPVLTALVSAMMPGTAGAMFANLGGGATEEFGRQSLDSAAIKAAGQAYELQRMEALNRLHQQVFSTLDAELQRVEQHSEFELDQRKALLGLSGEELDAQLRINAAQKDLHEAELTYQVKRWQALDWLAHYNMTVGALASNPFTAGWAALMPNIGIEDLTAGALGNLNAARAKVNQTELENRQRAVTRGLSREFTSFWRGQVANGVSERYGRTMQNVGSFGTEAWNRATGGMGAIANDPWYQMSKIESEADMEVMIQKNMDANQSVALYEQRMGTGYYDGLRQDRINAKVRQRSSQLVQHMNATGLSPLGTYGAQALGRMMGGFMEQPYAYLTGRADFGAGLSGMFEPVTQMAQQRLLLSQSKIMFGLFGEKGLSQAEAVRRGLIKPGQSLNRWSAFKTGMGELAGNLVGNVGGSMLGEALFPGVNPEHVSLGASLGTSIGSYFGPWGAVAGGLLGGLVGGLFGGSKPDPEEERRKAAEKQHQQRMEDLLSRIDKSLRPQADYFRTVKGEVLFGTASRWYSGRAYAQLGLQGSLAGR